MPLIASREGSIEEKHILMGKRGGGGGKKLVKPLLRHRLLVITEIEMMGVLGIRMVVHWICVLVGRTLQLIVSVHAHDENKIENIDENVK